MDKVPHRPVAWIYDTLVDNRFSRSVSLWNPYANIDAHNIRPLYELPLSCDLTRLLEAVEAFEALVNELTSCGGEYVTLALALDNPVLIRARTAIAEVRGK